MIATIVLYAAGFMLILILCLLFIRFLWRRLLTPRIFVSYRRKDSRQLSEMIRRELRRKYGPWAVFKDTVDLTPGESYPEELSAQMWASDVVVAVADQQWAGGPSTKVPGKTRVWEEDDWVRREVTMAAATNKLIVARVNQADIYADLPAGLAGFATMTPVPMGDEGNGFDLGMKALNELISYRFPGYWSWLYWVVQAVTIISLGCLAAGVALQAWTQYLHVRDVAHVPPHWHDSEDRVTWVARVTWVNPRITEPLSKVEMMPVAAGKENLKISAYFAPADVREWFSYLQTKPIIVISGRVSEALPTEVKLVDCRLLPAKRTAGSTADQ